ncbi:MAG: Crp/Fnr family transcriptional regulator [Gammaproteobacteria bacterium]
MTPEKLLEEHYLFRNLQPDVRGRLLKIGRIEKYASGHTLFLKGDPGNSLFGVLDGQVRIASTSINGRETVLNTMITGEVFGEIALLDGKARSADAVTASACSLFEIQRSDFLRLLRDDPGFTEHVLTLVCERVRWISERVEDFSFLNVAGHLAKMLLMNADQHGTLTDTGIRLDGLPSQGELAKMIGTSRVSVNKHLQNWKREGIIQIEKGRVTLLDEEALDAVVNADPVID